MCGIKEKPPMDGQTENTITANSSIAIIGAGAAGLSAAEALKKKGYSSITLYERSDRVGGKCNTVEIDGREYEYGAGVLSANNRIPLSLAEEHGVPIKQAEFDKTIHVNPDGSVLEQDSILKTTKNALAALKQYRSLFSTYDIASPGFAQTAPELMQLYTDFEREYGLEPLRPHIEKFFTGFGYSYLDDVPAIYVLKYANLETVQAFLRKKAYVFVDGIQELWNVVAREHNVRLNSQISNIARTDGSVEITDQTGTAIYDALIITSPLDELHAFMDVSSDEDALFSKIKTVDYRTISTELSGFPPKTGYVPEHFSRAHIGKPVFWYHRHDDTDVYTFYAIADDSISDEQAIAHVQTLVANMSGQLEQVHTVKRWKYFPHVDTATLQEGFYDSLEAMQGNKQTYYAGELMNFSCVGFTAEYATDLVERFF